MADVITSGATVIVPTLILGYESSRPTRTVVHPVLSATIADASLRAAGLRLGRMELGFSGPTAEEDSRAAEMALSAAATFSLTSSDRTTVQMTFVLPDGGNLSRTLEDTTRAAWVIAFDWQEVTA